MEIVLSNMVPPYQISAGHVGHFFDKSVSGVIKILSWLTSLVKKGWTVGHAVLVILHVFTYLCRVSTFLRRVTHYCIPDTHG